MLYTINELNEIIFVIVYFVVVGMFAMQYKNNNVIAFILTWDWHFFVYKIPRFAQATNFFLLQQCFELIILHNLADIRKIKNSNWFFAHNKENIFGIFGKNMK